MLPTIKRTIFTGFRQQNEQQLLVKNWSAVVKMGPEKSELMKLAKMDDQSSCESASGKLPQLKNGQGSSKQGKNGCLALSLY